MTHHISRGCAHSAHAECFGVSRATGPVGVPQDAALRFRNHHGDLHTPYNIYPDLESRLRKWKSMIAFTKEIWRARAMQVSIFGEAGKSLMVVESFISARSLTQKDNDGHHGDPNDPRVRLKRDCVGIMAAFKLKDPSQHVVIVANTHLYWDPNWADVKLAQAKYLLARLAQFKILVSDKFECSPSVIVGGDINFYPWR